MIRTTQIDLEGVKKNNGIDQDTFDILMDYIRILQEFTLKQITYVEIGVQFGGTFKKVLPLLRPQDHAIGIDLFEMYPDFKGEQTHGHFYTSCDIIKQMLEEIGFDKQLYTLLVGDSTHLIPTIPNIDVGYGFVDANHTFNACKNDVLAIDQKIECGVFQIHDTDRANWGCKRVAEEITPELGWVCDHITHSSYFFTKGQIV
jgi:hypothetical protein